MATEHESILEQARRAGLARPSAGLGVPDGYFESFADHMASILPEREAEKAPEVVKRGLWATVRPYVYMAAMFAGIWLMLHMFTMLSGDGRLKPMDSNPVLAEALSNEDFVYDYIYDDLDDWDIMDEMMEDSIPTDSISFQ